MPKPEPKPIVRRLTNEDVRTIFDCVYNDKIPDDERLKFKIIVVGQNGMKLSPPSFEFEDGLYILLKPLKKASKGEHLHHGAPEDDPRIPSNLKSMVFLDSPPTSCPWSLSGPQFPVPTAIQQRYCYPKGNPEYSTMKGGALWTTYDEHGKEDLEFRLLHVYYSAKRAGNRGRSVSASDPPRKRSKKKSRRKEARPASPFSGSFSSASFDSVLSFDLPKSPEIDPSLFSLSNFFGKTFSNDDEEKKNSGFNENDDKIITPDRSVFDSIASPPLEGQYQHESSNRYFTPAQFNSNNHYHHFGRSTTSSSAYPMHHSYPHQYYRPYPYWSSHSSVGGRYTQDSSYSRRPPPNQQYPVQEVAGKVRSCSGTWAMKEIDDYVF